eukprot:CAMPEP_0194032388 /NCGR_PEP_ID=MMETSP0009_2-20130614/5341_1 /TAXON_ID=210454 /ORGANISM="Grammatophora oceanica, Strain CCMP 410" /LENGTH=343 /DNA_ID=CAMNT_0038672815 /DNA_START=39 /DNA_END=1070 /DNA_ORIENTATION=-
MEYAAKAQYRGPLKHYSGNADRQFKRKQKNGEYGSMQYRPATTYRWEETVYRSCQPTLITREGMCQALQALDIRRIFILGDSLNLQLAQSMWMLLTTDEHGDSPTKRKSLDPNFETIISCPNGDYDFKLMFVRNDEFLENDLPVSVDDDQSNCETFCYPWVQKYLEDQHRTLLLANAGAHVHAFDRFQHAIDRFIEVFDSFQRPWDIALFRTIVPGHWDCSREGLTPFKSFQEYEMDVKEHTSPKLEEAYSWNKFASYNDYAIRQIEQRARHPQYSSLAMMEVVDVFPMTILRPDGHCSDEFRPDAFTDKDCLHYDLPGPVDWWSHSIFSHLLDIIEEQKDQY